MTRQQGFIAHVKQNHPQMWQLIQQTAQDSGLIVVDEENDAITATNRLLWTNPVLHECLATLVDQWADQHAEADAESAFRALIQGDEEETRFNWGVKSLPWLILTDSKHIVVAEGFGLDSLDDKIQQTDDGK